MNQFIESLRRLYVAGRLDAAKIAELCKSGTITNDEADYILTTP